MRLAHPWNCYAPTAWLVALLAMSAAALTVRAEMDRSRYMAVDEIRPGMTGFGRTVMSGTKIETFEFEVIDVLSNAFYAKQDVILVRCRGLNLEHTGVIAGMSGSPCYIKDETSGQARMIGAVAYALGRFPKDPICGLQPIMQMLPIADARDPAKSSKRAGSQPATSEEHRATPGMGTGLPIGQLIAKAWPEPLGEASRFSLFNKEIEAAHASRDDSAPAGDQLRPLKTPVMISGASEQTIAESGRFFEQFGLQPVASGGASQTVREHAEKVKLEPGSAICVQLMSGDINIEGFGTCTEVDGDRAFGFGHAMFGQGRVELPMATGHVHMVVPSMMLSTKVGTALRPVGTLWGDENSGIFGINGPVPALVPLDVTIDDVRGKNTYHYEVAHDELLTGLLLRIGALESIFAHNSPPPRHTIRYSVETDFEGLGTFRSGDFTSQEGVLGLTTDVTVPAVMMLNTPFGKTRIAGVRVQATIEEGTRVGRIERASVSRLTYKPGETVTVRTRWFHDRGHPLYTEASYAIRLPDDIPDGSYKLTLGSARTHLTSLRSEKPHLFSAETLDEALDVLNRIGQVSKNRVYLRLPLPSKGLAVKKLELPKLPSYRARIYADAGRKDIRSFTETLVTEYETDFVVQGDRAFTIKVDRRMDQ